MFTGIIEELGTLQGIERGTDSARLVIKAETVLEGTRLGDSIAVNGVCLTATDLSNASFSADVMFETLAKTNLGSLRPGDRVNLERAMRLGDRLGGHMVSGHVDGVGTIAGKETVGIAVVVTVKSPPEVLRYIIKKGSVAIDGISLTVVDHSADALRVSIIPHTARLTTLGYKRIGDSVNLEADLIARYIERMLPNKDVEGKKSGISGEFLARHGFV